MKILTCIGEISGEVLVDQLKKMGHVVEEKNTKTWGEVLNELVLFGDFDSIIIDIMGASSFDFPGFNISVNQHETDFGFLSGLVFTAHLAKAGLLPPKVIIIGPPAAVNRVTAKKYLKKVVQKYGKQHQFFMLRDDDNREAILRIATNPVPPTP